MLRVTIHHEDPFAEPQRNPVRRFRGRMPLPVTVWTAGHGQDRVGWTVSSVLLADGDPAEVLGLLDEDSALADLLRAGDPMVVNLLGPTHRALADAFAGLAPAPGGVFRLGTWQDSDWGPVLVDAAGWLGVRITSAGEHSGWSLLVRGLVEQLSLQDADSSTLGYLRGRYRDWPGGEST